MRVLIGCEFSGTIREAFKAKGHDAWSCDLLPTEIPGNHYQCDIFEIINEGWDLMIAHPPCTYLTVTGNKWFLPEYKNRFPTRIEDRDNAVKFFIKIATAKIKRVCIENPIGVMSTLFRPPDQIIQPYLFGDSASKATCLWLNNLPKLKPTNIVCPGEFYTYRSGKRMAKWYADAASKTPVERQKIRNKTFQGIADAMAEQWTALEVINKKYFYINQPRLF